MKNIITAQISDGIQSGAPALTADQVSTATQKIWQNIAPHIAVQGLTPELENLQKEVIALRKIANTEREYKAAQAQIKRITGRRDYEEPVLIPVENHADHDVPADGKVITRGARGEVYSWQLRALQPWLTPVAA